MTSLMSILFDGPSIIPHLLLPPVLFFSLYFPPFPYRAPLFAAAITATVGWCFLRPWPPDNPSVRYGMAGSWFVYVPLLEKLLLHREPEREFYRRPDVREVEPVEHRGAESDDVAAARKHASPQTAAAATEHEDTVQAALLPPTSKATVTATATGTATGVPFAASALPVAPPPPPAEFSLAKARWVFLLLTNPRAVNWSHEPAANLRLRGDLRWKPEPRVGFVQRRLRRALRAYLCVEAAGLLAKAVLARGTGPELLGEECWWLLPGLGVGGGWDAVWRRAVLELLMGWNTYEIFMLQWCVQAALWVGLGWSGTEDWPPLFGPLTSACTVGAFWGEFWHGLIRQPCLGFGRFFIAKLGIPRRSTAAYVVHLLTAFSVSGLFHVLSTWVGLDGQLSFGQLSLYMGSFFLSQAAAIAAETVVLNVLKRRLPNAASGTLAKCVGYGWTLSWLLLSGWQFVRVYVEMGVMDWGVPLPILKTLLDWAKHP